MPKKLKQEIVTCQHFSWRLGRRQDVFYADGRSNRIDVGRHSLGTKDKTEALGLITQLDATMAVKFGLTSAESLPKKSERLLLVEEGIALYMKSVQRPLTIGGTSEKTAKRYRAIFDKFKKFSTERGVRYWQEVNRLVLEDYGSWLADAEYAPATLYIEINTLKQAINWFIHQKQLPESAKISLPVKKTVGTSTFCYTSEQVEAILNYVNSQTDLSWLGNVVTGLVYTGLRIGELAQLRWAAVDLENKVLQILDNTSSAPKDRELVKISTKPTEAEPCQYTQNFFGCLSTCSGTPTGEFSMGRAAASSNQTPCVIRWSNAFWPA